MSQTLGQLYRAVSGWSLPCAAAYLQACKLSLQVLPQGTVVSLGLGLPLSACTT